MRKGLVAVAGLLLVFALAFLLLPRGAPPPIRQNNQRPFGEITIAYPEEPLTLDPYSLQGQNIATADLLRPVLPTFLSIDSELRYRKALATRVPSNKDLEEDPFTVTFRIDKRAVWSDGVAVTSGDVRFTWEAARGQGRPRPSGIDRLTDVSVIDDKTVKLVFDRPFPAWRDVFSAGSFLLPRHLLEGKNIADELLNGIPASAGPFLIKTWTRGLEVVYEPNPRWWGRPPRAERIRVQFVPDTSISLQLLEGGRVQALATSTQLNLRTRGIDAGAKVRSAFGSAWWELAFNVSSDVAQARDFRAAVVKAFDRAALVEALIRDEGRALQHLAPGRQLGNAFGGLTLDREAAANLLAGAGYRKAGGGTFTKAGIDQAGFSVPAESGLGTLLQRSIYNQLKDSGIALEVQNPRADLFFGKWIPEGTFDIALVERRGTPSMSFESRFHSSRHPPRGLNVYRIQSGSIDEAIAAAEASAAWDRIATDRFMTLLAEDLPAIPIFESKAYLIFRPEVTGPKPNATVDGPLWNLQDWELSR